MKLVMGLGNPGSDYALTRHNAGFLFVDELQKRKDTFTDFLIKKSDVFMNESGTFVKKLVDKYKLDLKNLYIVHDDLDIVLGEYKIQFGRGPKDHNGLKSIDDRLATSAYWHVRVGIDSRPDDNRPLGQEFVLQNFTDEELKILDAVFEKLCKEINLLLR